MGMPPGGGSSWAHHGDGFELFGDDGALWARVQTTFDPPSLDFLLPSPSNPFDSSYVFSVAVDRSAVRWTWRAQGEPVVWKPDTAPERLVLTDVPGFHGRVVAQPSAVTVVDASGTPRVAVRLGGADPSWSATHAGALRVDGKPVVSFCVLGNVRAAAWSLP